MKQQVEMKIIFRVCLGLVLSLCFMASAWADEGSADYQEMMRLSAEGHELYEQGDLQGAAKLYAQAYELYPQAVLLKNQMVTLFLLEECEESVQFGQAYLESGEAGEEDKQDVNTVFAECSVELATAAVEKQDWADAQRWLEFGDTFFKEAGLEDEAAALTARVEEAIESATDEEDAVAFVEPPGVDGSGGLSGMQIGGWSLTVLGSGLLVWGALWNVQGLNDYKELSQGAEDGSILEGSKKANEMTESINRARIATPILYGVGGASLAAGVTMLLLPALSKDQDQVISVAPIINSDVQGASLRLRF